VEQVEKSERATLRKVDANEASTARPPEAVADVQASKAPGSNNVVVKMMGDLEKGQGVMDKLIHMGLSGRQFSNSELIALQAGMYKYTQELELTGKVVEKATSGLKDTLKTQV